MIYVTAAALAAGRRDLGGLTHSLERASEPARSEIFSSI
jgi:hypothetical protein